MDFMARIQGAAGVIRGRAVETGHALRSRGAAVAVGVGGTTVLAATILSGCASASGPHLTSSADTGILGTNAPATWVHDQMVGCEAIKPVTVTAGQAPVLTIDGSKVDLTAAQAQNLPLEQGIANEAATQKVETCYVGVFQNGKAMYQSQAKQDGGNYSQQESILDNSVLASQDAINASKGSAKSDQDTINTNTDAAVQAQDPAIAKRNADIQRLQGAQQQLNGTYYDLNELTARADAGTCDAQSNVKAAAHQDFTYQAQDCTFLAPDSSQPGYHLVHATDPWDYGYDGYVGEQRVRDAAVNSGSRAIDQQWTAYRDIGTLNGTLAADGLPQITDGAGPTWWSDAQDYANAIDSEPTNGVIWMSQLSGASQSTAGQVASVYNKASGMVSADQNQNNAALTAGETAMNASFNK